MLLFIQNIIIGSLNQILTTTIISNVRVWPSNFIMYVLLALFIGSSVKQSTNQTESTSVPSNNLEILLKINSSLLSPSISTVESQIKNLNNSLLVNNNDQMNVYEKLIWSCLGKINPQMEVCVHRVGTFILFDLN